jgi:hypothetical protein
MRLPTLLIALAFFSSGAWSAGSGSSYNSLSKTERTYSHDWSNTGRFLLLK